MKSGILEMASISETISEEETLAVRFAKIVDQLLQNGKLIMLGRRPTEADIANIDGFFDGEFCYFLPENLYGEIKQVFSSANRYLPLDMDEMIKNLYEEGLIMASPNGAGKKVYYARILVGKNRKCNFLKFSRTALQQAVEKQ